MDDGGSAYWMGMEALRYALMSYDGRLAKSVLPEKIAEHFGLKSMEGVAALFHSQAIEEGAVTELAYLVKETAAGRDRMAQRIEKNAAAELYLLAQSLIRKLDFAKRPVLLGGSILLGNESVRQELTNLIRHDFPQCPVAAVRQKPETGALWLAIRGR